MPFSLPIYARSWYSRIFSTNEGIYSGASRRTKGGRYNGALFLGILTEACQLSSELQVKAKNNGGVMFIPEFINEERGEFLLIANHSLASEESIQFSIDYNLARISYGQSQLPPHIQTCRVIYDTRGQSLPDSVFSRIGQALERVAIVEFER